MSKHYDNLTIKNYISENETIGYELTELENNLAFMQEVLFTSHDKKYFYKASKEVRESHDFIMFTISLFRDDIPFILEIVNDYFNYLNTKSWDSVFVNDKEMVKKVEVALLLREIVPDTLEYKAIKTKCLMEAMNFYTGFLNATYEILWNLEDFEFEMLGLGFVFANPYSDLIKKYIAESLLKEIFLYNKDYPLEDLLHYVFKNKDALERYGVTSFLLDYVTSYDESLGEYLEDYRELLTSYQMLISNYLKNWDNYMEITYKEKFASFYQEIEKYQLENPTLSEVDTYSILKYLVQIFGLENLLNDYFQVSLKDMNEIQGKITTIDFERAILELKTIFALTFEPEINHKKSSVLDWSLLVANNKNRFFGMTLEEEKSYK